MKKIIFLILILVGSNLIDAYSSVTVTVRLARNRDCKGFGWCKVTIVIEPDGELPKDNIVLARVDMNSAKQLVLKLNRKTDLTPEAYKTYFSTGSFLCEDDFPMPPEVLKALGYAGSFTVKEGTYPITMQGDVITIVF